MGKNNRVIRALRKGIAIMTMSGIVIVGAMTTDCNIRFGESALLNEVYAAEVVGSGSCGATSEDNVNWSLTSDGVLTISGTGAIESYSFGWSDKKSSIKRVVIGSGVTAIGADDFGGCTNLTSVSIANTVTVIGNGAFSGCTSLSSVEIPNSVTALEMSAFEGCSGLKSVSFPSSLTSIGEYSFASCASLTTVNIPASVTMIGDAAFSKCGSIQTITVDANNE